jgi:preprotein translocase subunit SecF
MSKNKKTNVVYNVFRPLPLGILTVVCAVVCVLALRANNNHMGSLRAHVYAADKNNGNVTLALQNLQKYVTHHMNTNLSSGNGSVYPPVQLKYTYQRLLNQESSEVASNNSALYTDAQNYCQQIIPTAFSGRTRVPCIEQYIETHDSSLATIPTSLYEFDFVSPNWSPDLAGYSLIATTLSFFALVVAIIFKLFRRSKS